MYPILIRLADRGLLETRWEADHVPGRPARHMYRLTGTGREFAAANIQTANIQTANIQQPGTAAPASTGSRSRPRLQGA
jgi:DNA-binding PadR family transcriptional regulator